ncbi:uncharacterized protein [Eucyclogobius newberryi]|uniref:uncharacterized protein n=1 Tax=Eucyclogobius newberryi TaxID=166745 RepID=UPI003B58D8FC
MALTLWLCALCLQASLLAQALHCPGAEQGAPCQPADTQSEAHVQQMGQPLTNGLALFRAKRQLERRGPTHLSQSSLPGAVSVKGFPNTLIQADRSRRHLALAANKKKSKRKSRVGSYSLLTHDKSTPLQVIRARRQVKNEPSRGKIDRSGAFSILSSPENQAQTAQPK